MVAALRDLTEHGVDTIKPIGFAVVGIREELATTGVWSAGLVHGDGPRFVLQAVIGFIGDGVGCLADTIGSLLLLAVAVAKELRSMATGPITVGEIALNHEVLDNSVESRVVVIAVFHEEFEILNVDGGIAWIKLIVTVPVFAPPFQLNSSSTMSVVVSARLATLIMANTSTPARKMATIPAGVGVPSLRRRGNDVSLMPLSCISLSKSLYNRSAFLSRGFSWWIRSSDAALRYLDRLFSGLGLQPRRMTCEP